MTRTIKLLVEKRRLEELFEKFFWQNFAGVSKSAEGNCHFRSISSTIRYQNHSTSTNYSTSTNQSTSTTVSVPSSISSTIRLRKNPAPPSGREICGRLVSQGYWFTRTNASTHLVAAVLLVSSQGKLAGSNVLGLR